MFYLAWFALSIVAGVIASHKRRSAFGFFLLALLLSPLVGIISALVATPNREAIETQKLQTGESKKCPFCAELLKPEAKVCRFCGKDLPDEMVRSQTKTPAKSEDSGFRFPTPMA